MSLKANNHRTNVPCFLHDPNFQSRDYDPWKAYANSKAGNVLFAVALDSIGKSHGIRAFSAHPGGIIETGLARHMDLDLAKTFGMIDEAGLPVIAPEKGWKSLQQGASTMVWGATSPLLEGLGGLYLTNAEVGSVLEEDEGDLSLTGVSPGLVNPVNAGRLWQLCEQLTGVRLD